MLNKFADWLQSHFDTPSERAEHSLELCIAVLYQEVMRADHQYTASENDAFKALVTRELHVTPEEWKAFESLAREHAEEAVDLIQFTKVINQNCDLSARRKVLDKLWLLAYSDGELAPEEEYIIRKISDLMHIPHSQYIQSKLSVLP